MLICVPYICTLVACNVCLGLCMLLLCADCYVPTGGCRLRSALMRNYIGPFVRTCGTPLLLLVLGTVLWCTLASCRNISSRARDREEQKKA